MAWRARVFPNRWACFVLRSLHHNRSYSAPPHPTEGHPSTLHAASVQDFSSITVNEEVSDHVKSRVKSASSKALDVQSNEGGQGIHDVDIGELKHLSIVSEAAVDSRDAKAARNGALGPVRDSVTVGRQEKHLSSVISGHQPSSRNTIALRSDGSTLGTGLMTDTKYVLAGAKPVANVELSRQQKGQDRSSEMQIKIDLLHSEQCSPSFVAALREKKAFKSCCFEQLATVLQVLKMSSLGGRSYDMLLRRPYVLHRSIESWQQMLKVLADFQVEEAVHPYCLFFSAELLERKLAFCADIGMTGEARQRMLQNGESVLAASLENTVRPSMKFLESTGLTGEGILKLMLKYPQAFRSKGAGRLKRLYNNIQQVGIPAAAFKGIARGFMRGPSDKLLLQTQALQELGFSDDDVQQMVKRLPVLLVQRPERLKEKLHYLVHEQRRSMAEIVRYPRCLMFSLDSRIIPRFNFLKRLGRAKVDSLYAILSASDRRFHERFTKYLVS